MRYSLGSRKVAFHTPFLTENFPLCTTALSDKRPSTMIAAQGVRDTAVGPVGVYDDAGVTVSMLIG